MTAPIVVECGSVGCLCRQLECLELGRRSPVLLDPAFPLAANFRSLRSSSQMCSAIVDKHLHLIDKTIKPTFMSVLVLIGTCLSPDGQARVNHRSLEPIHCKKSPNSVSPDSPKLDSNRMRNELPFLCFVGRLTLLPGSDVRINEKTSRDRQRIISVNQAALRAL